MTRAHRLGSAACASLAGLACLAGLGIVSPAAAAVEPTTNASEQTPLWTSAREETRLELDILDARPITLGESLALRVKITNPTDATVTDMQVTARRGDAVDTAAEARTELAVGDFPYFGASAEPQELGPGESLELTMTVPTQLGPEGTLAITQPGSYPVGLMLTGSIEGEPASLASDRFILEVDTPSGTSPAGDAPADDAGREREGDPGVGEIRHEPHALSVVYPVSSPVDIVPGETGGEELILSSDRLANELAEGGRLDRLLDIYLDHDLRGAGCVALDPALVDTVSRMAQGYTVHDSRPSVAKKPKRLRDSWFTGDERYRGEPGGGSADAAKWLERLKELDCTMAMPWANADPSAAAATNNTWLLHEAVGRGKEIIEQATGHGLSTELLAIGPGYISQALPYPALVADNSAWTGKAATFDATLGTLLAQTGPNPQTVGYSNPELRYDYTLDSERSRALTAAAALGLTVSEHDTVAALPNVLDPEAATAVLDKTANLIATGQARGRGIATLELKDATGAQPGSPFADPAAPDMAQLQGIEQQARYTDELTLMMDNDPAIAMTRYGFTMPLRRDLLTALSVSERASLHTHNQAVSAAADRMARQAQTIKDLRASVSLIPPGNVYTRTSDSSPLLIVAENGLPLPVVAKIDYEVPDPSGAGTTLNTPSDVRIPALGSITVTMTANLPSEADRTNLRLWLATPDNDTISQPITIAVQTRGGIVSVYGVGALAALVIVLALLFRFGRKRKFRRRN